MLITPIARLRNTAQTSKALERALELHRLRREAAARQDVAPEQA